MAPECNAGPLFCAKLLLSKELTGGLSSLAQGLGTPLPFQVTSDAHWPFRGQLCGLLALSVSWGPGSPLSLCRLKREGLFPCS